MKAEENKKLESHIETKKEWVKPELHELRFRETGQLPMPDDPIQDS